MVHALYCGYPASLDAVGKALNFSQDKRKMSEGRALIRYFCVPCAPTQRNGGRTRNLPKHDPGKWKLFKEYCKQDVFTEREIKRELQRYPVPEAEQKLWELDQLINIGGVAVDQELICGALEISDQMSGEVKQKARDITGLDFV